MEEFEIEKLALFEDDYWWSDLRRDLITQVVKSYLNPQHPLKILDLGCGTGGLTKILTPFGSIIGVDASPKSLTTIKRKVPQVETKLIDLEKGQLPFANESFDLVTGFDVLEHVQADRPILTEIKRVLKSGGFLMATVPAHPILWTHRDQTLGHKRRYRHKELKNKLLEAGFKIIKLSWFNFLVSPAIFFVLLLLHFSKNNQSFSYSEDKPLINPLLKRMARLEVELFKKLKFPFGISLLAVARKE